MSIHLKVNIPETELTISISLPKILPAAYPHPDSALRHFTIPILTPHPATSPFNKIPPGVSLPLHPGSFHSPRLGHRLSPELLPNAQLGTLPPVISLKLPRF